MSLARRTIQVVAFIATLIVGVAAMAVIVAQTAWFKEWLRGFIVRQADDYVNGRLTIGRLDGNLFFGVEMEDVDVTMNGKSVVALKDVGVDYNLLTFLGGHVILNHIRLNEPTLHAQKTATGWNLTNLIKAQTPHNGGRKPLEIAEIGVSDATVYLEDQPVATSGVKVPAVIDRIDASVGVTSDANELKVNIGHVSLRGRQPEFGINDVSGIIRQHQDSVTIENLALRTEETSLRVGGSIRDIDSGNPVLNLKASSDKFSMRELAQLIPSLRGYENLQPAFEVNASGPVNALALEVNAREKQVGQVIANIEYAKVGDEQRIAGAAQAAHLNVGPLVKGAMFRTDVTGRATLNVHIPPKGTAFHGTYGLDVAGANLLGYVGTNVIVRGGIDWPTVTIDARGDGYGGRATAKGSVDASSPLRLDLAGTASNIDLRNLPPQLNMPGAPSNLQFSYTLKARGPVVSGDAVMDRSTVADATIANGTTATFTLGNGAPSYGGTGHVDNLDVQKLAHAFNIPLLDQPRYQSRINGDFDVTGSGGSQPYPLTLDGSGTLVNSQVFGAAVPRLEVTTNFANGNAHVNANGQFNGLDPSKVSDDARVAGSVNATVNADVTLRHYASVVTADSIDATGTVNATNSTIGGLAIDTATIDGTYTDRVGNVNQFIIEGPDIHAKAMGPIALNDSGSSKLVAHLETPALDRLGHLAGQDNLKGGAVIETTITGNGQQLKASGTFDGSNVGYGDNSALDTNSTFDVTLPQLSLADATIHAKTNATFLQVAGQPINSVVADTTYTKQQLEFDATAKQGVRQLTAQGSALLHTDHNEVHIGSLALQTEAPPAPKGSPQPAGPRQIVWRTDPASHPTVQYGDNRVVIDRIALVNGDQRIEASGAVGGPADSLHVKAENVDVAQLDALALGDQRLAGRLNANATVSGTTAAPRVAGDFSLLQGAFRNFKFMSFGGKVDYADKGMSLDVRLDQDAQSWLTAKGFAPVTLFQPTPASVSHEHVEPSPGDAVNIDVASSQIDLGAIQGFTSYVTKVTGTVQANFKVTGSGYDPHLDGAIDIHNGAFTAPDLGTSFSGLDTRIDLKPDAVTISEFKILDKNKKPMTIGGSLAVHEREVGAVDVKVTSDDFKVVANSTADLKFDSDVHITGTVRAPKVEGSIEVEPGTVDIGEILEEETASPYSTTATEISPEQSGRTLNAPSVPSLFDAMEFNLGLAVPGDLLIKGNNIRPASAPIDVGSMNAYVGGAVNVSKAPGGTIQITGEVNTVRGSYTFQGRRFEILRDGRIRFTGGDVIDPILDLQAQRAISGVQATVHVRGTMLRPELSFSSNPPLDESDILSLIIFNQPVNELGEGQQVSLATRAGELAGGYLASGLSESIGRALNLDEFEIQAAGDRGVGPTVTLGQQVAKGVFVRLQQGIGAEQATEFILEYQINSFMRMRGTASDVSSTTQRNAFQRVERGGLDLIFFFNY